MRKPAPKTAFLECPRPPPVPPVPAFRTAPRAVGEPLRDEPARPTSARAVRRYERVLALRYPEPRIASTSISTRQPGTASGAQTVVLAGRAAPQRALSTPETATTSAGSGT